MHTVIGQFNKQAKIFYKANNNITLFNNYHDQNILRFITMCS